MLLVVLVRGWKGGNALLSLVFVKCVAAADTYILRTSHSTRKSGEVGDTTEIYQVIRSNGSKSERDRKLDKKLRRLGNYFEYGFVSV